MKSKFLSAAALACAISLAAPGIASAQETSSVSASGTSTFCAINGVEVSCDTSDRPAFEMPDFEMPDFEGSDVDVPTFDRPSFGRPDVTPPTFDRPSFDVPTGSTSGSSSSVTVTSSSRAVSNGNSTTTSTLCTVNGVEVPCDAGTSAIARSAFDFSAFGR